MDILRELEDERDRIDAAIRALTGGVNRRRRAKNHSGVGRRGRRRLSAAARKRISEAAKARWAQAKKAGKTSL